MQKGKQVEDNSFVFHGIHLLPVSFPFPYLAAGRQDKEVFPRQFGPQGSHQFLDGDSYLIHRISVSNGDLLIFQRLEINGDAERSANLVLASVATANALGGVVLHYPA
jgi:hypothetical protein